jgi:multiple antibiotic resistance protein
LADDEVKFMSELLTSRSIGDFHFGFDALFAIINPYGLAFVFLDRTMGLSERDRARIALRVAIYAFLVSLFAGSEIMRFFGISMPALRIAGGLVVAVTGWSVLNAAPKTSDGHASSIASYEAVRGMTFFPLTIPLTTGPGTIATAIAIGTNRPNGVNAAFSLSIVWLVIAFAVAVTIYHAYEKSSAMARLFGEEGTSVVTRLSAFLLLCIGVQIMINGVVKVAQTIHNGGSR